MIISNVKYSSILLNVNFKILSDTFYEVRHMDLFKTFIGKDV